MAIDMRDIASLARMMTRRQSKTTQMAYGTVVDVDTNGVTWVQLDGSDAATPTKGSVADVKVGDAVVVTVRGGRAFIEGSTSSPSVGTDSFKPVADKTEKIEGTVNEVADSVAESASSVKQINAIVNQVREMARATSQYFWHRTTDTDGAGAGGFVTDVPRSDFEYAAEHDFSDMSANRQYFNLLMNSLGLLIRRAVNPIVAIAHDAISFYDGLGNNASNIVAMFGKNGARIGTSNSTNVKLTNNSMGIYYGTDRLATFHSEAETTNVHLGGSDKAVGVKYSNAEVDEIYNYINTCTVIDGVIYSPDGIPSSYTLEMNTPYIHYVLDRDGDRTTSGAYAGIYCDDSFDVFAKSIRLNPDAETQEAHIEIDINRFKVNVDKSQAVMAYMDGTGRYHAKFRENGAMECGKGTIASSDSQSAIGKWNVEDANNTYALIIGNGTADDNRSNALTLDWNGNLDIAGKLGVRRLSWTGGENLTLNATANNQEWSIDLRPENYTGTFWQVWSATKDTILRCNADDGVVTIPFGLYTSYIRNRRTTVTRGTTPSSDCWFGGIEYLDSNSARVGIVEMGKMASGYTGIWMRVSDNTSGAQGGFCVKKNTGNTGTFTMTFDADYGTLYVPGTLDVGNGYEIHIHLPWDGSQTSRSTDVERTVVAGYDTKGQSCGQILYGQGTNGVVRTDVRARRTVGGNIHFNQLRLMIGNSGECTYSVSHAANFRSAIGAAASSDRRLKSNIRELGDEATDFIRNLVPCEYDIHEEHQVGLIAQDVHDADPWHTRMAFETEDGIDGLDDWEKMKDGSPTWKLDYIRIIPPLVATAKSQARRIEELEDKLSRLEKLVESIMNG